MKNMPFVKIFWFLVVTSMFFSGFTYADKPTDEDALRDINEGKVVWDVTVGNPSKLLLMLNVIEETYDDLTKQNVKPNMVFAFHGPVVKLISTEPLDLPLDEEEAHQQVLQQIKKLSEKPGV